MSLSYSLCIMTGGVGGGGDARSPYGQAVVLLWVAVDLAMLAIIMLCVGKPT